MYSFDKQSNRARKHEKKKDKVDRKRGQVKAGKQEIILSNARDTLEKELGLSPERVVPRNQGLTEFSDAFTALGYKLQVTVSTEESFLIEHPKRNSSKVFLSLSPEIKLQVIGIDLSNKCIFSRITYKSSKHHFIILARDNCKLGFATGRVGDANLNSMAALYSFFPCNVEDKLSMKEPYDRGNGVYWWYVHSVSHPTCISTVHKDYLGYNKHT